MTDQTARQRRGPVFNAPLTRWQRRQKHLQEQPSVNRALIGFTPDGQAVVNPVQAELRRLFKGIVSRPAAARLEGIRNRNPSTHEDVEATTVHVVQTNRLCTEPGREARRVRITERDERSAEYRVGLARQVAEMAAQETTEASMAPVPNEIAQWVEREFGKPLSEWHTTSYTPSRSWFKAQRRSYVQARKRYNHRRHGANRAHDRKVYA